MAAPSSSPTLNQAAYAAPTWPTDRLSIYLACRPVLERFIALLLLIPGLPLIGVLVVLIRVTSPGPAMFRQIRVGRGGRKFTMYKLRSMRLDAETASGPVWSAPGVDPRVTRLGYWLRRLHLDELPQLFNVLKGDMSLIGPRPERPEFVKLLRHTIPGYLERLQVLPGVTGLAQINLPPDTTLDDVRRKLVLDKEYMDTTGPWLDLRIILCTALRLCGMSGERAMRAMRLQRTVELPASPTPAVAATMPLVETPTTPPAMAAAPSIELPSLPAAIELPIPAIDPTIAPLAEAGPETLPTTATG
jgi:lipopolysaccharide/colanic/teichoic acid biosynthesis glycosyltransferase